LFIPGDEVWFGNQLRSVPRFQVYNVPLRPALEAGTGWQSGLGSQSYLNIFSIYSDTIFKNFVCALESLLFFTKYMASKL